MPAEQTPPVALEVTGDGTIARRVRLGDIPDNETAKRAVEVALAGGHGIAFIYQQGAPGPEMLSAVQGMAQDAGIAFKGLAAFPCPCGCFATATQFCTCSMKRIIAYRKKLARRMIGCDMAVEVLLPWGKAVRRGDPEERIMERVRRARAVVLNDAGLSQTCQDYLKMYSEQISGIRIPEIQKIAATVCRMDSSSTKIQPCHLMEAIHYQWLSLDLHRLLPGAQTRAGNRIGA